MGHVHHRTSRAWKISHKLQNQMSSGYTTQMAISQSLQPTSGLNFVTKIKYWKIHKACMSFSTFHQKHRLQEAWATRVEGQVLDFMGLAFSNKTGCDEWNQFLSFFEGPPNPSLTAHATMFYDFPFGNHLELPCHHWDYSHQNWHPPSHVHPSMVQDQQLLVQNHVDRQHCRPTFWGYQPRLWEVSAYQRIVETTTISKSN